MRDTESMLSTWAITVWLAFCGYGLVMLINWAWGIHHRANIADATARAIKQSASEVARPRTGWEQ